MGNYIFNDGANWQAQAVAAYICNTETKSSFDLQQCSYLAQPTISRWYNGREQGYVISLSSKNRKQLNIAFFEHRNSDNICAVAWEQQTINPPTIDTAKFGNIYKDKWDVSHTVNYGQIVEMGEWIVEQLDNFYTINKK